MTRLQDLDLDDLLDDLDDLDATVAIGNINRIRTKREPRHKQEDDVTSFERWVETRKGGEGRRRRDG